MVVIKTKDIRTILYSIAKQLNVNDKFKYEVTNSWTSIISMNGPIKTSEMSAIRAISNIRKNLFKGKTIDIYINNVKICKVSKEEKHYVVQDYCNKMLEYIFFELIGECQCIIFEVAKKNEISSKTVTKYGLESTYTREHIINYQNLYEVFSYISSNAVEKFKEHIVSGEEYNAVIKSKLISVYSGVEKKGEISFEFDIVM